MPIPSTGPIIKTPSQRLTVSQIFDNNGLIKWWLYPSQYFGVHNERGTDFGIPYQSKVGSITSGVVVYAGWQGNQATTGDPNCASIGYVVQISSSDGLYHYQHLASATVAKGAKVNAGDIIGYSGGLPIDNCSKGVHIEVRWSSAGAPNGNYPWFNGNTAIWSDPYSHFITLSGNKSDAPPEQTTPQSLANAIQTAPDMLMPNSNVAALLNAINIIQETRVTIPANDSPNPFDIFSALYITIIDNTIAFIINTTLILLGVYIFFKLMKNVIDLSTLFNNISSVSASNRALQLAKAAL